MDTARSTYDESLERLDLECNDLRLRLGAAQSQVTQKQREVQRLVHSLEETRAALHRANEQAFAAHEDNALAAADGLDAPPTPSFEGW